MCSLIMILDYKIALPAPDTYTAEKVTVLRP